MSKEGDSNAGLIKEIAQYLFDGSPLIRKMSTIENTIGFIYRSLDHVLYVQQDGRVAGVAVYMMLTDSTLEKIVSGEIDLKNEETFKLAEKENGNNLHIFSIRSDRMIFILKGLKNVLEFKKPKTVSWIKPDGKKITIITRRI